MSLKKQFASGSGWMAISATADYALQFIVFAVLARLLSVSDLGVVAFALVLTDLGRILVNGGMAETIVQRSDWDERVARVCFTVTMIAALVFAIVLAGIAAPLVERYYRAGSGWPTAALSLIFLIEAGRAIHSAKLRREFRYRELAGRAAAGTAIAGVIAVVLAFAGWGVWALVFQRLGGQLVATLLTWRAARWRPRLLLDRAILRQIAPFSLRVTASRALDILTQRAPDVLVGVILGPVAVALYRVGARSLEAISRVVILPLQDAAFSALSRLEDRPAIGRALQRVLTVAGGVVFPIFLGGAVVGEELTVVLFGAKYDTSGAIMSLLAIGLLFSTLGLIVNAAYLASGRGHALIRSNVAAVASMLVFVGIGATTHGVIGAAAGTALAQLVATPINFAIARRELSLHMRVLVRALAGPFIAAAAMAVILMAVRVFVIAALPAAVRLGILLVLGGITYPAILLLVGRGYVKEFLSEVRPLLPGALRRRMPGAAAEPAGNPDAAQAPLPGSRMAD